ncbi:trypco2 family protein [Ornithinimicrobium sp. LYQ103]|uniref:trypco2 family protein n=1 Tax=Ornithinimicrobium sp. LYQ103 TaxID=3378796 RepID=UPI003852D775
MADGVPRIGLAEAIEALHAELGIAAEKAAAYDIHFPIGSIELELQVGITENVEAKGGFRAWVVELGAGTSVSKESIHRIRVSLQAPVNRDGKPVLIGRQLHQKP